MTGEDAALAAMFVGSLALLIWGAVILWRAEPAEPWQVNLFAWEQECARLLVAKGGMTQEQAVTYARHMTSYYEDEDGPWPPVEAVREEMSYWEAD